MSRFLSRPVEPYVPGEQPAGGYLKLNTNESPYPPSPTARSFVTDAVCRGELYPDPECKRLAEALSRELSVDKSEIICANGSDALLNYAFAAFCRDKRPIFPDLTYGFYKTLSGFYGVEPILLPLKEDFTVDVDAFCDASASNSGVVFLPNPNAPTGVALHSDDIERIVGANGSNIVVIDEAYVDFGTRSAVPLIKTHDNLIVTRTFSKSRSLAGERLGFAVADRELIRDLSSVKFAVDPYCVTRTAAAAGVGALRDVEYFIECRDRIIAAREYTKDALRALGFFVTDSSANFVFCRHDSISGAELCAALRREGILVRHFGGRAEDFIRVTIGKMGDMKRFISATERILP